MGISVWRWYWLRWYERHRHDFVFYRCLEKQAMLPWLNLQPNEQVCELGCFNGANARVLSQRYDCHIYGVDIDPDCIQTARLCNSTDKTHYQVASAESLPFADNVFDKIYGISVLEHFISGHQALQEVCRCLKPGGVLVLTTDSFTLGEIWPGTQQLHTQKYAVRHYYTASELQRAIETAKLQVLHLEPILRHRVSGFLFELSVRFIGVKSLAFLLLPLIRWIERRWGAQHQGYMLMACAVKPANATVSV